MKDKRFNLIILLVILALAFFFRGEGTNDRPQIDGENSSLEEILVDEAEDPDEEVVDQNLVEDDLDEEASYSSLEEVAFYIYSKGHLPDNFLTKKEAQDLGWVASEGNLWQVAPGMSIGGDRFHNREGLLPEKEGRVYYEADIDYEGGRRGAKRIVFSSDGLIFYTDDHYSSFREINFE